MTSARRLAFASGVLYLVTFATSIPAYFFYEPMLTDSLGGGTDTMVILGAFLELVCLLAGIGTAVAAYPVIRRQSEAASLGFVTTRMFEAAVMVIGVIAILAIVSLRQAAGAGAGGDTATLTAVGRTLVDVRDHTAVLGPGLVPGLNALCFGYALYRSRLVPRVIPALGLIGAPLFLTAVTARIFGIDSGESVFAAIALAPIFFWELSIGIWMTFKGFNRGALAALGFGDGETTSPATGPMRDATTPRHDPVTAV